LGEHKIGFETKDGEKIADNENNNNQGEVRGPKEQFSRLTQDVDVNNLNEKRRQALLRASEKQELLLQNLLDAVERRKKDKEGSQSKFNNGADVTVENVVEEVIQKQILALSGLKHSVEEVGGTRLQNNVQGNDKDDVEFVGERLKLLEDASHRQLEVLESLIDAVQRLDSGAFQNYDRLKNLETITVHQNQMLDQLSTAMMPSSTSSTDLTTSETIRPRPRITLSPKATPTSQRSRPQGTHRAITETNQKLRSNTV
jgi:hypothetical protein